ncbi:MAG: protein phosphatase CheZ [Magnetospiraceae bacterium]
MDSDKVDNERLRRELFGLMKYIQRIRLEVAAINRSPEEDQKLERMTDQLDAIVEATEEATNTIMEKIEDNETLIQEVREKAEDADLQGLLDQMSTNNMDVFEACSFQDITGQRVSKVLKSVRYVEDRVSSLVEIWGRDALEVVDVGKDKRSMDEKLLRGPQLKKEASISQDDIDKLFD